jgi:hypothetical protein
MPVLNLPPLKENASSVTKPPRAGVWVSDNVNLDAISDSFDIPNDSVGTRELKSIPDVWAQFQVFNSAFVRVQHPMHAEAVKQWRSLLTLFALSAEYGDLYEIVLKPTNIDAPPLLSGGGFIWVLHYLLPEEAVAPKLADWTRPVLVSVRKRSKGFGDVVFAGEDVLIGLLNPVTLIAPGKCAALAKLVMVPWMADGLADPTEKAVLKQRDYNFVARYAARLYQKLGETVQQQPNGKGDVLSALLRELENFSKACAALAGTQQYPFTEVGISAPHDLPELYTYLTTTFAPDFDKYEVGGACGLILRADIAYRAEVPLNGIILVDPALAHTANGDARNILVWKHRTLSDLQEPNAFAIVDEEASNAGYLIVKPEDFFTEELVILEKGTDIKGHVKGSGFEGAVLPLSPLALLTGTPQELAQKVRLEQSGGREFKVSLELDIAGIGRHVVSRTYTTDPQGLYQVKTNVVRPLGVALWPDFFEPKWRWNFLRFQHNPATTDLLTRFGASAEFIFNQLRQQLSPSERVRKLRNWIDTSHCGIEESLFVGRITPEDAGNPNPPFQRLRFANAPDVGELQISSTPFEAICFARAPEVGTAPRPVGLVLVSRKTPDANAAERIVAFDFGTTNTVVCFDGQKAAEFQDRVVFPIESANSDKVLRDRDTVKWSFVDFFPLLSHGTPFPTVATRRSLRDDGDPQLKRVLSGEDERPMFSDCVYFMPQELGYTQASYGIMFQARKGSLRFGLKWNSDPLTRKIARRFLRQIMMMISAELVAGGVDPRRVSWRFSYPEAMTQRAKGTLHAEIRRSWNELFPDVDGDIPVETPVIEGAAAANFFLYRNGDNGLSAGPLAIIFDIGGGSTEIAVWSRRELQWRGSFRLAGGDFFTHYLENNPEFFEKIGLGDLDDAHIKSPDITSSLVTETPNSWRNWVELVFDDRRFPVQFSRNYASIADSPVGAGLRYSASVALGGIVYYLGHVLNKLPAIPPEDYKSVSFAFGGRGSEFFRQYFHLAGGGNEEAESPLTDILKIFTEVAGPPDVKSKVRVLFSRLPKLEVVLGMASNKDTLERLRTDPRSRQLPIGEVIKVTRAQDKSLIAADQPVEELLKYDDLSVPKLVELRHFLALHEKYTGIRIGLDGSDASAADFISEYVFFQLRDALKGARDSVEERDLNTQLIEPPFIAALRALIDRLGQKTSVRSRYLKVTER